jgi:hypothetical protein
VIIVGPVGSAKTMTALRKLRRIGMRRVAGAMPRGAGARRALA